MSTGFKTDETTQERTDEFVQEPGDHDRYSHYLAKRFHGAGYLEGQEVEALCGHRWVPTKDPERFPVCPECKDIYDSLED